ncbi:MAG: RNA methyltransferase, partial [Candidatus Magasanikbacteria bacterium]|nr:RNA methyltransferase [Candidatus Magasanikbacteria bacterium]
SEFEIALVIMEGSRRDEPEFASILKLTQHTEVAVEFCGRKDVGFIKDTETFPGVLAVVDQQEIDLEDLVEGPIICLDNIKDPGNLGTIIRTADWFGIKNILLSENSVDPYNPKVVRSTMGSMFHVHIFETGNLKKTLKKLKENFEYKIYSLDLKGKKLSTLKPSPKSVYIFGSESHGVSEGLDELIDERYTIEKKGEAESLNVAIATGILLSNL